MLPIEGTHPDNDQEAWVDKQINKLADRYAACDRQSAELNKERKDIRDDAEKLGITSKAFQHAVNMVKNMTEGERRDYQTGVNRTLKAIGERQGDLFPEQARKNREREERRAAEEANKPRSEEELNAQTDANRRSDPDAGGAKVQTVTDQEQAEGAAILEGKSKEWRTGFNAATAGGARKDNPYIEGSAEAREWLAGFGAATDRAFEASKPAEPPAPPAEAPAKPKAKLSQSAKGNAKKAAAGVA
jgi:hypothetical protein